MRLKLDLHPIYSDSHAIEAALRQVIDEAVAKRVKEVEIIPGKGSGALKKSVIRFLQRPEIRSRYHRMEKDSENWGRLSLHFRHERAEPASAPKPGSAAPSLCAPCVCCGSPLQTPAPEGEADGEASVTCPACDSPHRLTFRRVRRGDFQVQAELDYGDA
ncbi:MAG: Smr/MutS family protein [Armatimonadetes bacterium]|nr:Smr/MutS family protein [Armatimonadota bacterium]